MDDRGHGCAPSLGRQEAALLGGLHTGAEGHTSPQSLEPRMMAQQEGPCTGGLRPGMGVGHLSEPCDQAGILAWKVPC